MPQNLCEIINVYCVGPLSWESLSKYITKTPTKTVFFPRGVHHNLISGNHTRLVRILFKIVAIDVSRNEGTKYTLRKYLLEFGDRGRGEGMAGV